MATASVAVRLNAITGEFETAFSNATRTVAGFEKTFGSAASSVRGHQDKMNAAFAAFSGDKIIAEANQLAGAITKVGGAAKLTEAEQKKANAVFTEALAKMNALGEGSSAAAQKMALLANATKQVEQPVSFASKAMGVLGSTFAQFTAANLAATAITKVVSSIGDFAAQGAKLPGLQASFENLTRGVGSNSTEMIASLQNATRGLVTNIDLMQSANKAILLGLPVTTKEMGDLAKTATVLGKAMGQDATKSLDDLITALGRSSPLILDNLGLTVKVGEANEAYAAKLGKTVEQLTDAEKKTAFYNAAMDKAREKVAELGEQTRTFGEIVDSVWVRVGNSVTQTVSDVNIGLGAQIDALLRLIPKTQDAGAAALEAAGNEKSWSDELKVSKLVMLASTIGLGGYVQNLELHAEAAKASADQQRILNKLMADAPKPEDVFKFGEGARPNQFGTQPLDTDATIKQWIQDQKDAEAAAKRAAEAMAAVDKKIVALIRGSKDLTVEQRRMADFFLDIGLSASETALKIGASEVAVAAFDREMRELDKILDKGVGSVLGLGDSFKHLGTQVQLTDGIVSTAMVSLDKKLKDLHLFGIGEAQIQMPVPRLTAEQERILDDELRRIQRKFDETWGVIQRGAYDFGQDLAAALGEGIRTGDWGTVKDAVQDAVSRFVSAGIEAGINYLVPGLGTLMKPLIDAVSEKLVGLFRDTEAETVNDLRDDFLSQFGSGAFGGFNELARQLNELGPAGDAIFQRVINATKVEDFNRAMADANAALDKAFAARPENQASAAGFETIDQLKVKADAAVALYEYVRDSGKFNADTVQKAWERANAALIASGDATAIASDKARKAIDELDSKLKGLYNSIANEAPEEVMGVIEAETRAKIAAIEEEKKAAQSAIDAEVAARSEAGKTSTQQYKDDADEAYTYTRSVFEKGFDAPVRFTYPNGGPVGLNTSGGGSSPSVAPSSVTPVVGTSTTIIELDGQVIAEATAPYVPGAARRYVGA